MENSIFAKIGIDPFFICLLLLILVVVLFVMVVNLNMKYERMKSSYNSFMRGKDGKTLEKSFQERFNQLDTLVGMTRQNRQEIRRIIKEKRSAYQKVGIVKYDAFNEMGGKLSFALAMLDDNDNGWIINAMHSREGCYTYIKEIVKGESYIELSEEEADALERAVYQEAYGLDISETSNLAAALTGKIDVSQVAELERIAEEESEKSKRSELETARNAQQTTERRTAPGPGSQQPRKRSVKAVKGTKKIKRLKETNR